MVAKGRADGRYRPPSPGQARRRTGALAVNRVDDDRREGGTGRRLTRAGPAPGLPRSAPTAHARALISACRGSGRRTRHCRGAAASAVSGACVRETAVLAGQQLEVTRIPWVEIVQGQPDQEVGGVEVRIPGRGATNFCA